MDGWRGAWIEHNVKGVSLALFTGLPCPCGRAGDGFSCYNHVYFFVCVCLVFVMEAEGSRQTGVDLISFYCQLATHGRKLAALCTGQD